MIIIWMSPLSFLGESGVIFRFCRLSAKISNGWAQTIEPCHEKTRFLSKQISAIVFTIQIVPFLFFLNSKFQVSFFYSMTTGWFVSDLDGNPGDCFSHIVTH